MEITKSTTYEVYYKDSELAVIQLILEQVENSDELKNLMSGQEIKMCGDMAASIRIDRGQ